MLFTIHRRHDGGCIKYILLFFTVLSFAATAAVEEKNAIYRKGIYNVRNELTKKDEAKFLFYSRSFGSLADGYFNFETLNALPNDPTTLTAVQLRFFRKPDGKWYYSHYDYDGVIETAPADEITFAGDNFAMWRIDSVKASGVRQKISSRVTPTGLRSHVEYYDYFNKFFLSGNSVSVEITKKEFDEIMKGKNIKRMSRSVW